MLIVKIPGLNNLGKNKGCRDAGEAILTELGKVYSNEQGKIIDRKLLDVKEIKLENQNLEAQNKLIFDNTRKILQEQNKVIFLGGDHSISYSIGKAFLDYCREQEKEPCLVIFDAHADCMKLLKEPTHEEWLRGLIEAGFPADGVLLVGARNIERQEIQFLDKNKINKIGMDELMLDLEEATDTIMEFSNGKALYVSFDIDVVDPVFAPSTGYLVPGGLTSRQALYIISRIAKIKNLKVFDLVEVNSEKDKEKDNLTVKLASKLLAELL